MPRNVKIHPSVDDGIKPGSANFAGGTLNRLVADMTKRTAIGRNVSDAGDPWPSRTPTALPASKGKSAAAVLSSKL